MVNNTSSTVIVVSPRGAAIRRRILSAMCATLLAMTLGLGLSGVPLAALAHARPTMPSGQMADGTPSPNAQCGGVFAGC
jgi:hypothetical protein